FGCRTPSELCRGRGWDKHWPSRLLGALPKRCWLKRLRRLGLEVLEPIWRHVRDMSPATQSRWQWTWVWDDSVFQKYGAQMGVVGGEGRVIVTVDFALRRPEPVGSGAPCRDKRCWARLRLAERLAALKRRGLVLPPPRVVAESGLSDSKLMQHGHDEHQGTVLV